MTAMQQLLGHFREENISGWFSIEEVEQMILDFGFLAEKKQIIDAFVAGDERGTGEIPFNCEQYYNQTYGNKASAPPAT
jgi:hypothetical protein